MKKPSRRNSQKSGIRSQRFTSDLNKGDFRAYSIGLEISNGRFPNGPSPRHRSDALRKYDREAVVALAACTVLSTSWREKAGGAGCYAPVAEHRAVRMKRARVNSGSSGIAIIAE
jgi:hypothetical protein